MTRTGGEERPVADARAPRGFRIRDFLDASPRLKIALSLIPFGLLTPRRAFPALARGFVHLALRLLPDARNAVFANLSVAAGGRLEECRIRALVRRLFINYGLYLCDYMLLPFRRREFVMRLLGEVRGSEHLVRAREAGRGVLLVGPHVGNWEIAGYLFRDIDCPVQALSIREPYASFAQLQARFREREGIRILYVGDGEDPGTVLDIQKALARNEAVAMLGDRLYTGRSFEAEFFGRRIRFPAGPLLVAALTGAPIVPFAAIREGEKYVVELTPPILVPDPSPAALAVAGGRLAADFEQFVRRHPTQWFNFHRIFDPQGLDAWHW